MDAEQIVADVIGKYVRRYLSAPAPSAGTGGLTDAKLREHGFA